MKRWFVIALMSSTAACIQGEPASTTPHLELAVAPLTLPEVQNVCYTLAVRNEAGELLWSKQHVCADRYGVANQGSLSYVGTCDATDGNDLDSVATNTVTLTIENLYDARHPWTGDATVAGAGPADWQNPCADVVGTPAVEGCSQPAVCSANADTAVSFNLTVMRSADQGFFDVAVTFQDIFCSAKVDCVPALLQHTDGTRGPTAIVALACTSGQGDTPTQLYLDDLDIDCQTGADYTVAPIGPGGLLGAQGPGIFQASLYYGSEALADVDSCYWNTAIGLGTLGNDCHLKTRATASQAAFSDSQGAFQSPDATTWPVIDIDVTLTSGAGAPLCTSHPLNGGNGVATTYTTLATGPEGFDYAMSCGGAPTAATPAGPVLPDCTGKPTTAESVDLATMPLADVQCLQDVTGAFTASTYGAVTFTTLWFPYLRHVGSFSLQFDNNITELSMPALERVDGQLEVWSASRLTELSLPKLTSTGGKVYVVFNDALTRFSAPLLTNAGGFELVFNKPLAEVTVPLLATVTGDMTVAAPKMPAVILPALTTVGGDLALNGNGLASTIQLPALLSAQTVSIGSNLRLTSIAAPLLAHIGPPESNTGSLSVRLAPLLPVCDLATLTTQLATSGWTGTTAFTDLESCPDTADPGNDVVGGATTFSGVSFTGDIGGGDDVDWIFVDYTAGDVQLICFQYPDMVAAEVQVIGGDTFSLPCVFDTFEPVLLPASDDGYLVKVTPIVSARVGYALRLYPVTP